MRAVRISNELRRSILDRLRDSYRSRKEEAETRIQLAANDVYKEIYDQEEVRQANLLGSRWVNYYTDISVNVTLDAHKLKLSFSFPKPGVACPMEQDSARYYNPGSKGCPVLVLTGATDGWKHSLGVAILDKLRLEKESESLVEHMGKVISNCNTTTQLAAVWPSFVDYVSEEERKRLFTPIERKTVKKVLAEVKIDDATSILLAKSRLTK